jgi:hypothetical protein
LPVKHFNCNLLVSEGIHSTISSSNVAENNSFNQSRIDKKLLVINSPVRIDNAKVFMTNLGFNEDTIDVELKAREKLEELTYYGVLEILNENYSKLKVTNSSILTVLNKKDLTNAFLALGFSKTWSDVYTWMVGRAFADQTVIEAIRMCLLDRLSNCYTKNPFPANEDQITKNDWTQSGDPSISYYTQYRERQSIGELGNNEREIKIHTLKRLIPDDEAKGSRYWFHATSWTNAQSIADSGPRINDLPSDFSSYGAFYLNDDYCDCYTWFIKRNSIYRGLHAMLIYKFNPEKLGEGEKIQGDVWKQLVYECRQENSKSRNHWYYGPQCANPSSIKDKKSVQARYSEMGTGHAMQLGILHTAMCTKIHDCLVGVVFYQNVTPTDADTTSATADTSSCELPSKPIDASAMTSSSVSIKNDGSSDESTVDMSDVPQNKNHSEMRNDNRMNIRSSDQLKAPKSNMRKRKKKR